MAEPLTFYDLEFHFTHGEPLYTTVQEGKDALSDGGETFMGVITEMQAHANERGDDYLRLLIQRARRAYEHRQDVYTVTVIDDDRESTMTVHRDKLNAVLRTKRIVHPEQTEAQQRAWQE